MRSRHHDLVVTAPTAPAAAGGAGLPVADRDGRGRFRAGSIGGPGRPRGSRNKLGEDFIAAVYEDWYEHGPAVLARVREQHPAAYLKIAASLVPSRLDVAPANRFEAMSAKELLGSIAESVASFAQDEEFLAALAEIGFTLRPTPRRARRQRPQMIQNPTR